MKLKGYKYPLHAYQPGIGSQGFRFTKDNYCGICDDDSKNIVTAPGIKIVDAKIIVELLNKLAEEEDK